MGRLTKSLPPTRLFACSPAQLFISLGTILMKIEVFEQKCFLAMCASSLKFIETNWDGTPDKVLAARSLARLTGVIYFTRHRCTRYNLGVVASCFFSRTDIFTYLYHETLYPALSLAFC